jgi:hypothetical protein
MTTERRHSPRLEILGRIHGHSVSLNAPVTVVEISLGGMAVETPFEFPVGVVNLFRLTLGDESTVDLEGRVLRCRSVAEPGEAARFRSGLQFVDDTEAAGPGVGSLLKRIL